MSFFNNTKNAGLALTVIGIVLIVGALVSIAGGIMDDGGLASKLGMVVVAIGGLIAAVVYFKYGNSVRKGEISEKIKILGNYVKIVGLTTIIMGFFMVIGDAILTNWGAVGTGVVKIILGAVVVFVSQKIMDDKQTTFDKIIWIALTVLFVILFASSFIAIFGALSLSLAGLVVLITNICYAVVYLFMLAFMFDSDVKKAMNM